MTTNVTIAQAGEEVLGQAADREESRTRTLLLLWAVGFAVVTFSALALQTQPMELLITIPVLASLTCSLLLVVLAENHARENDDESWYRIGSAIAGISGALYGVLAMLAGSLSVISAFAFGITPTFAVCLLLFTFIYPALIAVESLFSAASVWCISRAMNPHSNIWQAVFGLSLELKSARMLTTTE